MDIIKAMESRLSEYEKQRLRDVYAPQIVGVQPSNAWMDMCVLPDGEIRHYGNRMGKRLYIYSRDCGFTWQEAEVNDNAAMCSGLKSPYSERWIMTYYVEGENGFQGAEMPNVPAGLGGWQAALSDEGPGGKVQWVKITDLPVRCPRYPLALRSRKRILAAAQLAEKPMRPIVARTDDDGLTWQVSCLKSAPIHEQRWPHQGVRWQNGSCEPTIVERTDGSLLMLTRTSQDYHYQYESFDGGETWTDPVPSRFHATLTMPTMLRMRSDEIVLFWCNTQPLPELDKHKIWPPMNDGEISGWGGEDVFTNRDVNHAAISMDDGKSWHGFREVLLNPIRNDSDFRTSGGAGEEVDKSVHQFQAIELPFGKILLSCGQHKRSRRLILLDPKWLLEEGRSEDFAYGIQNLSTHVYLKSVSGNLRTRSGHCAWNRMHGAVPMPDPDGNYEEALYICANPDPRLFTPMQGAVWNFPAAMSGEVTLNMLIKGDGLKLTLADRWFNPCDEFAPALSQYSFSITGDDANTNGWLKVKLMWDTKICRLFINGKEHVHKANACDMPDGISYIIMQSEREYTGRAGTYVKRLDMSSLK